MEDREWILLWNQPGEETPRYIEKIAVPPCPPSPAQQSMKTTRRKKTRARVNRWQPAARTVVALSSEEKMIQVEMQADIAKALAKLPRREAEVIRCRFGLGGGVLTLEEISRDMGCCTYTVRAMERRALRGLWDDFYQRGALDDYAPER